MMLRATIICLAAAVILMVSSKVFTPKPAAADEAICNVPADAALGLEDYQAAIRLHQHWLLSHPKDALAHYHLGFAYGMVGRGSEEIGEYQKAVFLGLHEWDLFLNLGLAYAERGNLSNAATALKNAVLLEPGRAEPHFNLALVYEAEHRLGDALKEITISRRLRPEDQDIENAGAILCAETGDLSCARNLWTHLAQSGYSPAQANLAILDRITDTRSTVPQLIGSRW